MRPLILALVVLVFLSAVREAGACNYHQGLAAARFDAVHPMSLSVAMAIHRSTELGFLHDEEPAMPTFAGVGYRRAVGQLRDLEQRLSHIAKDAGMDANFSFVFVRSRLWAEYTVKPETASAVVHTAPADDDAMVVLSDEAVLAAIANGRLTFSSAVDQGLVQFSGDHEDRVRSLLRDAMDG